MEDKRPNLGNEKVTEAAETVKREANSRLSSQKDNIASSLSAAARAVRQTQTQLRDQDQPLVAEYATTAANQIDRLANYVRDAELGDMVGEVEGFARRQPALFLGGAFLLGVLGARFLKSSGRPAVTGNVDYRTGYYRGAPGADYSRYSMQGARMGSTPGYGTGGYRTPGTTGPTTGGSTTGGSGTGSTTGGTGGRTGDFGTGSTGGSTTGAGQTGSGGSGFAGGSQTGGGTQPRTTTGPNDPHTEGQNRTNPSSPSHDNKPSGGSEGR